MLKPGLQALILVALISGCLTESDGGGKKTAKSSQSSKETPKDPDFSQEPSTLYWYSGQPVVGNITVNQNSQTVIYLRGSKLHTFLSVNDNFSKTFCLVVSFNNASVKKNLRARAMPISFNNLGNGTLERLLRIDLPESAQNASTCLGTALQVNAQNTILSSSVSNADSAFDLPSICTSCSGVVESSNVSLYTTTASVGITASDRVSAGNLNLTGLGFRVDVRSSTTDPTNTCTNSTCSAKGFNCCLEGQCVNDAQIRPNASTLPEYNQALADMGINPRSFLNYPNVFFICPQNPVVLPTPTPFPDANGTANAQLEQLKIYYYCLEEGKKTSPNYAGNAVCPPSFNQAGYESIRSTVWRMCGCNADPFPTDPLDPRCPNYGLKATMSSGVITKIECDIPKPDIGPTPFQSLSVSVPARSAPHLFFRSDTGAKVENLSTLTSTSTVVQEGETFMYLDEIGKTDPVSSVYSMNSVLGQMTVNLNRALPAKTVDVELDQVYVITTRSGYYNPCPKCDRDAWYKAFTAFPSNGGLIPGSGLQAVGYSTSRDTYQSNATYGNYEDTVFGRACWVPPTMIAFSHKKEASLNTQRRNRLKTQAAYFINGYKRDWYGFNKGALIGSFNGVTWFAIGNARKIQATSQKLYLAINAPFADLADPTNFLVDIIVDQGHTSAAEFDYDPALSPNHPKQNQGATCRAYHQCEVDSDCVTKLGWEYSCMDIGDYKTYWPQFDSSGNEKVNTESSLSYAGILQGLLAPGSTKRCVYRGAGAPCKKNYTTIGAASSNKARQFTCAPNFYCAGVNESAFNTRIVRTPANIQTFQFGQEAEVLGRPENYVLAANTLSSDIVTNMQNNASLHTAAVSDWGICRPGKVLQSTHLDQHQSRDNSGRTDFGSQVSSCDADSVGNTRVASCPAFETVTGQTNSIGNFITDSTSLTKRHQQNACGAEALRNVSGTYENVFKEVELEPIPTLSSIYTPSFAKDACFRRAGSVCHTDLDCSPNKMHTEQALFFAEDAFGGNEAEKKYWEESLICGQSAPMPAITSSDYGTYDMTKNRCCREVGSDLTMYTEITSYVSGDEVIFPEYSSTNPSLTADRFAYSDPKASGRYSRYSVASPTRAANGAASAPYAQTPAVRRNVTPKEFQWKTINDTGTKNCCGGGWVRKFSDGTHDWTKRDRLRIDVNNFACLNYQNPLPFARPGEIDSDNYGKDLAKLCLAPADGGCLQVEMAQPSAYEIKNPANFSAGNTTVDTSPIASPSSSGLTQLKTARAPYMPTPYKNTVPISTQGPYNYFASRTDHYAISFYLPIYIGGIANINSVSIKYFNSSGNLLSTVNISGSYLTPAACNVPNNPQSDLASNQWCIDPDPTGLFEIFHVKADQGAAGGAWAYAGLVIDYDFIGGANYTYISSGTTDATRMGMVAGNSLYYLTKLGRLELLGIPQIHYEPLYCNSDRSQLVSGIFDLTSDTRTAFNAAGFNYDSAVNGRNMSQIYDSSGSSDTIANPTGEIVFQDKVALGQVFSGSEFACCTKLGEKVTSASKCCSNHAVDVDGKLTCKLASGVDLSVYFNKLVSGEGMGENLAADPLVEADFIPETGEPKLTDSVNTKLLNLGLAYCSSGEVIRGGAFGYFYGEPNNGFYQQEGSDENSRFYSIVDSPNDYDPDNETGSVVFNTGYRWNHHFYCR